MNTYNIPLDQPQTQSMGMQPEPLYSINYQMPYYQPSAPAPVMTTQPQYAPTPAVSTPQYAPTPAVSTPPQYAPTPAVSTPPQYAPTPMTYGNNTVQPIPVATEMQPIPVATEMHPIPVATKVQPSQYTPQNVMIIQNNSTMLKGNSVFLTCPHCHFQVKTRINASKWALLLPVVFIIFFAIIVFISVSGHVELIAIVFPIGFFLIFILMVSVAFCSKKTTHICPACSAVIGQAGDIIRW